MEDINNLILENLNYKELVNLCQANIYFYNKCTNNKIVQTRLNTSKLYANTVIYNLYKNKGDDFRSALALWLVYHDVYIADLCSRHFGVNDINDLDMFTLDDLYDEFYMVQEYTLRKLYNKLQDINYDKNNFYNYLVEKKYNKLVNKMI